MATQKAFYVISSSRIQHLCRESIEALHICAKRCKDKTNKAFSFFETGERGGMRIGVGWLMPLGISKAVFTWVMRCCSSFDVGVKM